MHIPACPFIVKIPRQPFRGIFPERKGVGKVKSEGFIGEVLDLVECYEGVCVGKWDRDRQWMGSPCFFDENSVSAFALFSEIRQDVGV